MKLQYQIKLEVSFIVILLSIIIIYILFPKFEDTGARKYDIYTSEIHAIQIPKTYQQVKFIHPPAIKPAVPMESEEIEILDDIQVESSIDEHVAQQYGEYRPIELKKLPYTPRQLYEVLPDEIDEIVIGEVKLSLKIDIDGKVIDYKIIYSSIGDSKYLDKIVESAKRSRWAPAVINDRPVIYWVEKSYKFR
jgi:hypothetical protein